MEISVIIPSYRPGSYLSECLGSLARQTLDPALFEVIIVLNGCDHPYREQVETCIGALHSPVRFTLHQTDTGGVSNARNLGIELAQGTYIAFLDDDDHLSPSYLADLLSKADPQSIVHSNVIAYDETTGKPLDYFLTTAYARCAPLPRLSFFQGRSFLSSCWGKLIPRQAIQDYRFDTRYKLGEDSLFMFRLSRNIGQLRLSAPEAVYYVRHRPDSASHSPHPYRYRLKVALQLTASYIATYLGGARHYSFPLFLSRVAATLRKLFMRRYE